jgi:hypothetical protein
MWRNDHCRLVQIARRMDEVDKEIKKEGGGEELEKRHDNSESDCGNADLTL